MFMSKMRYTARMNNEWIERKIDHILVMCADVDIAPNPNEVANTMWVSQKKWAMLWRSVPQRSDRTVVSLHCCTRHAPTW